MTHQALPRYIVLGFLLIAICFVVIGYDRELPITDSDEGYLLSQTISDRGLIDLSIFTVPGYPPLIMTLYTGTQLVTESLRHESVLHHTGLVIRIMRIYALLANVVTVYVIYRIGKKLGYPLVGLVSAVIWAVLPSVNQQAAFALTEPFQIMFVSLSAWLMLKTFDSRKMVWALLCTLAGLLAVLFKYSIFAVLGFGVGTSLFLLLVDGRRRYWLQTVFLQIAMIGLTAFWVFFGYGANDLMTAGHGETTLFARSGLHRLLNLSSVTRIFATAAEQIGLPHLIVLVAIVLLGLILLFRQQSRPTQVMVLYMLIFVVSYIWLVPSFLLFDRLKYRYLSPASSILILLTCLSVWQIVTLLARRVKRPGATTPVFLLVCLVWVTPPVITRVQEVRELQRQETGQAFARWAAQSMEADAKIAIMGLEGSTMYWRYFNTIWGDYTGPNHPLVDILLYLQQPKSAWIDAGIEYVHLTGNYPGDSPPLPFDRDEMLLLKTFPNSTDSKNWRGDTWYIYRLQAYQTPSDACFAESICLRGYDLSTETVSPGDAITIRTYWQASQPPTADYHMYVHLSSVTVHDALAQVDGPPSLPTRITPTWTDPDETIVGAAYSLVIPSDQPAGTYRMLLGLYDFNTGQRLDANTGEQFTNLATITVQ